MSLVSVGCVTLYTTFFCLIMQYVYKDKRIFVDCIKMKRYSVNQKIDKKRVIGQKVLMANPNKQDIHQNNEAHS